MTIRITGDGPKITATGSGSTVLVEISTGQHDPGSFSGVHNDLTGRSTTGAHVGTAVSIDPSGFAGNLDESITNAQLLAAAVDDLTTGGGGGGGGGASLSDATPQALGTAAAGTGTAAARDDHVHAMPTAADVGAAATSHNHAASAVTSGTLDIARIPTGTTSTTAALGDHNHSGVYQPADSDLTTLAGLTATTDSFIQAKSSAWTTRTIAQVKTDLGITDRPPPTAKVVGYYAPSGLTAGNMTSPLSAAGTMAAAPVWLWAGSYTEVGNAYHYSGTSTVRFGLYDATGTGGYPGSLVSGADFGTISCVNGSPGAKSITISFTLATSGWYWIAALCDAYTSTGEFVGYSVSNGYGPMKAAGFPTAGDSNGASCVTKTGVTTGSMPSTFGTPTLYTGVRFPVIRLYLNS